MELQRQQGLKLTSVINFIIAIYTPLCKDETTGFVKLQRKRIISLPQVQLHLPT